MKLSQLIKTTARSKKRLGRGLGSGKGKTSGRGTKGQKARGKISSGFIGGTLPIYKKLPFRRGLGNPKRSTKMIPISLSKLNLFKAATIVDLSALIELGIVNKSDAYRFGVKIVSDGNLDKSLNVKLPVTAPAAVKIEKAGGKVVRE